MNNYQLNIYNKINDLQKEKKEKIKQNPFYFVLNREIVTINQQIANYQSQCKHELVDEKGICKICRKNINKKERKNGSN